MNWSIEIWRSELVRAPRVRRPLLLGLIRIGLALAPAILPVCPASGARAATAQGEGSAKRLDR